MGVAAWAKTLTELLSRPASKHRVACCMGTSSICFYCVFQSALNPVIGKSPGSGEMGVYICGCAVILAMLTLSSTKKQQ
jgi:hypothetical protein